MSYLSQVAVSGANMGSRIVIAAAEKMGKTTFAAGAPGCLLIPTEQGYGGVTVPALPLVTDWTQILSIMVEITKAAQARQFLYRTIAVDSMTALETLIHRFVIQQDKASQNNKALSMESSHGGYGKAYALANNHFKEFLAWADMLAINAGINFVFTAHVFSSKVLDPLHGQYDSWDILLHSPKDQKTYGKREILTQWADVVGYLHEPLIVTTTGNMSQGVSRGQGRVLGLERTPAYTAGNRYGMRGTVALPPPPANSWNVFARSMYDATQGKIDLFNREFA